MAVGAKYWPAGSASRYPSEICANMRSGHAM